MRIRLTIILTILAQFIAIKQNGYWGVGGNALMPIFCWIAFWVLPELIKELKKEFRKI